MDTPANSSLTRIKIRGFKSIKTCDLELKNLNVLIGSNGAGKSNFLSAFSLLQNAMNQSLAVYAAQVGPSTLFYRGTKITESLEVEVFTESGSLAAELIPTQNNSVFNTKNDYTQTVDWPIYHFDDTSTTSRLKSEHNVSNCKRLLPDGRNLAAFLYRLKQFFPLDYRHIADTVRLVAPYFDDFELTPSEANPELIVLRWRQKGAEDIMNASQLSDGTLRFMCLAALLLQPPELLPETLIIDEPELGLHPYAINIFAEMCLQIGEEKQVVLSTQSVELLNEFSVEDIVVVDSGPEGTVFKRLDAEELRVWLENDYSLGELWNKNILGGRLSK